MKEAATRVGSDFLKYGNGKRKGQGWLQYVTNLPRDCNKCCRDKEFHERFCDILRHKLDTNIVTVDEKLSKLCWRGP